MWRKVRQERLTPRESAPSPRVSWPRHDNDDNDEGHHPMGNHRLRQRHRGEERAGLPEGRRLGAGRRHAARPRQGPGLREAPRRPARVRPGAGRDRRSRGRRRLRRHAAVEPLRAGAGRRRGRQALPRREADGDEPRRVRAHERRVPGGGRAAVCRLLPPRPAALPESPGTDRLWRHRRRFGRARQRLRAARARRGGVRLALRRGDRRRRPVPRPRVALPRSARLPARAGGGRGRPRRQHRRRLRRRGRHGRRAALRAWPRGHRRVELQRGPLDRHDRADGLAR